jgi:AcrR family transcriptional regulator
MVPTDDRNPMSLQQQRKQLTADALIAATQGAMKEHGLDVTVDHIASRAGAGRRTVFRHFDTREALLEAALAAAMNDFERSLPEYAGGDWVAWLEELARLSHESSAGWRWLIWDLYSPRVPSRLAPYARTGDRVWLVIATRLWEAAGGDGAPPAHVVQVVVTHLGPLFTEAVLVHAHGTPELAAELATEAIAGAVRAALRDAG